jgi:predicted permease
VVADSSAIGALGLTLAVEAPLVIWLGHRLQRSIHRSIIAGLLPSLLTHPLAWQIWSRLSPHGYIEAIALIEVAVFLIEAVVLRLLLHLTWRQALMVSMLANTASVGVGWLLL